MYGSLKEHLLLTGTLLLYIYLFCSIPYYMGAALYLLCLCSTMYGHIWDCNTAWLYQAPKDSCDIYNMINWNLNSSTQYKLWPLFRCSYRQAWYNLLCRHIFILVKCFCCTKFKVLTKFVVYSLLQLCQIGVFILGEGVEWKRKGGFKHFGLLYFNMFACYSRVDKLLITALVYAC